MRKILFSALTLLSSAIYSSCRTDAVVPQPTGSLSCNVNRVQWAFPTDAALVFKPWDSAAPMSIDASRTNSAEYIEFELDFRNLKDTGAYFLNSKDSIFTQSLFAHGGPHRYSGIPGTSSFVIISQIDSTLKYFDVSRSPGGLKFINLKGTFGFICLNNWGDTVSITDGKFDLVCNPYPPLP